MNNTYRHAAAYPAILLVIIALAYEGGKSDWFGLHRAATSSTAHQVGSASSPTKLSPRPSKLSTLKQDQARLAGFLAGQWPSSVKSSRDKQNYFGDMLLSGEINPRNIPALIALLRDMPAGSDQQMLLYELIGRLAGIRGFRNGNEDPQLALQLLGGLWELGQRQQIMVAALSCLAASDVSQTLSILAKLSPGSLPANFYGEIFMAMAKTDAANAAAAAANLPPGSARDFALAGVAQSWIVSNPPAALHWAASLPLDNSAVFNGMIQNLAQLSPNLVAPYLGDINDSNLRNSVIQTIGLKLATGKNGDPTAALTWLNQMSSGVAYETAIANLFTGISSPPTQITSNSINQTFTTFSLFKVDASLAVSLLAKVTDPNARMVAIDSVADGWSKSDPQAALTWAANLSTDDASARANAVNTIMSNWLNYDSPAAISYAQSFPDPTAFLGVAPVIAQTMAVSNETAALTWTNNLPDGPVKTNALSKVLTTVAQTDFVGAWNYATNLAPGDSQSTIMANLFAIEANKAPTQAATLLDNIPLESAQLTATGVLATAWIKQDPQAFTIWLNGLPAGDLRDAAITQLASSSQAKKDPAGILAWVNTISNPEIKVALTQKLAQTRSASPTN